MTIYPSSFTRKPPMTRTEAEIQVARILGRKRDSADAKRHILGMGIRVGNLSAEAKQVYAAALASIQAAS